MLLERVPRREGKEEKEALSSGRLWRSWSCADAEGFQLQEWEALVGEHRGALGKRNVSIHAPAMLQAQL